MASDKMRVRPPAGHLSAEQVRVLAELLTETRDDPILAGSGDLETLVGPAWLGRVREAGLHARPGDAPARRVLCSPLSGRVGGRVDARVLAHRLELALRDTGPVGAGAFDVAVDDGSGDLAGVAAGLVFAAVGSAEFAVFSGGADTGEVLRHEGPDADLAEWLEAIARHSQAVVPDLPAPPAGLTPHAPPAGRAAEIPIGWLDHTEGGLVTLGTAVPGGRLATRQWEFLAAVERPVVLTPWRTLLVCDLEEWAAEQVVRVLAPLGFVFDESSPVLAELSTPES